VIVGATLLVLLFHSYTGEITTVVAFVTQFILHALTLFSGFTLANAIWNTLSAENQE
jgi:hypothetical protein